MTPLYIESSAILAWLFGEPMANKVIVEMNKADQKLTSVITLIEVERVITRAEKGALLKASECQKLRGIFSTFKNQMLLMELSEEVRKRAQEAFPIEPIRTLDAIHLATALTFIMAYPELSILSFDKRIIENAKSLGLGVGS